jgi:hypothetical protein
LICSSRFILSFLTFKTTKTKIMRKLILSLSILFALMLVIAGCGKTAVEPSVEAKLSKIWSARIVTEGSAVVYDKSKTTQTVAGYANYRLDLTSKTSAKLTERDGNSFTASWALSSDNKTLTLTFIPVGSGPTGTGSTNTKSYSIVNDVTTTSVTLKANEVSQKTGGTINTYDLVNP